MQKLRKYLKGVRDESTLLLELRIQQLDDGTSEVPLDLQEKYRAVIMNIIRFRHGESMARGRAA